MNWVAITAVATGGAIGALGRYGLAALALRMGAVGGWPWATFVANLTGSALMALLFVLIVERGGWPHGAREFLMVGLLGAFTTFSTFSLEALALWQNGQPQTALLYVVATPLCAIALAALVYALLR